MSKSDRTAVVLSEVEDKKGIKIERILFLSEIVITILILFFHALSAAHYANYYPINGTFQNFNPIRRLLNGQIPYRDFQDYLGLGHLYVGALITTIFGGTYRSSLAAFSFLTFGSLAIISYVLGLAILKKKEIVAATTNIVLIMLIIQPLFFTNTLSGTSEILDALKYSLGTGNSARFVRGLILPLFILLIWAEYILYNRMGQKWGWLWIRKDKVFYIGLGLLSGFSFAWSNDYGISCWVCTIVMTFWISLSRTRRIWHTAVNTLVEVGSSLFGLITTVMVFTHGHLTEWLSSTFGTGGYQSWYYNSAKSYYLYQVDFSFIMLIQAGVCIVYMIKVFLNKGNMRSLRRYGIPGFVNMVCFCAVNEYQLLSGGNGSRQVALAVLFLTIMFEVCALFGILENSKKEVAVLVISSVVGFAWIVSDARDEFVLMYMTDQDGVYVEALGGNLTELGDDLIETDDFLEGNDFFATYASAQEVVSNVYQPSGTDYIIHVLGDKQRTSYLNAFNSGNFKYAATIKETYTDWEYWVQRANWFFYRELYASWHPVYANTYEVYWERNTNERNIASAGIELSIVDIDETSKKIVIQADASVNGIADVYIDYAVNKNNKRSSLLVFQKALQIVNTGTVYASQGSFYESNYLRDESKEYIPIPIVNGYGEVTLSAGPKRNTILQLNGASCNQIFTCTSDYLEILDVTSTESDSVVRLANTAKNMNAIKNISHIEIQGSDYVINEIENDDGIISLGISTPVNYDKSMGNYMNIGEK